MRVYLGSDHAGYEARLHNNANVLNLGARMYSIDDAIGFAKIFLSTPFLRRAAPRPAGSRNRRLREDRRNPPLPA